MKIFSRLMALGLALNLTAGTVSGSLFLVPGSTTRNQQLETRNSIFFGSQALAAPLFSFRTTGRSYPQWKGEMLALLHDALDERIPLHAVDAINHLEDGDLRRIFWQMIAPEDPADQGTKPWDFTYLGFYTPFLTWNAFHSIYSASVFGLLKHLFEKALEFQVLHPLRIGPLTSEWIEQQLMAPFGIWHLARMLHPYTLQVLASPDLFTHHFTLHEGMYYTLYAMKCLGRLPPGGAVVFNIDPHTDEKIGIDPYRTTATNRSNIPLPMGVVHANWAEAVVLDGLAEYVVTMDQGNWTVIDKVGGVVRKKEYKKLPPEYLERARNRLWVTVDLDFFSLNNEQDPAHPARNVSLAECETYLKALVRQFKKNGLHPLGLTTAVSPDYLTPEKREDAAFIASLQRIIQKEFETVFAPLAAGAVAVWFARLYSWIRSHRTGEPPATVDEIQTRAFAFAGRVETLLFLGIPLLANLAVWLWTGHPLSWHWLLGGILVSALAFPLSHWSGVWKATDITDATEADVAKDDIVIEFGNSLIRYRFHPFGSFLDPNRWMAWGRFFWRGLTFHWFFYVCFLGFAGNFGIDPLVNLVWTLFLSIVSVWNLYEAAGDHDFFNGYTALQTGEALAMAGGPDLSVFRSDLVRFAARKWADQGFYREEGEDSAHDVFLAMLEKSGSDEIKKPKAYLFRAAAHEIAEKVRAKRSSGLRPPRFTEGFDEKDLRRRRHEALNIEESWILYQINPTLRKVMAMLCDNYRQILWAYAFVMDDPKAKKQTEAIKEILVRWGAPETLELNAIRQRLLRAQVAFQQRLGRLDPDLLNEILRGRRPFMRLGPGKNRRAS